MRKSLLHAHVHFYNTSRSCHATACCHRYSSQRYTKALTGQRLGVYMVGIRIALQLCLYLLVIYCFYGVFLPRHV